MIGSAPRNATPFKTVIFMPKFNKIASYVLIVPTHIIPAPNPLNTNPTPLITPETIDNVFQFLLCNVPPILWSHNFVGSFYITLVLRQVI